MAFLASSERRATGANNLLKISEDTEDDKTRYADVVPKLQSEEIKRDPEMDKSAVWAGSGCMAVFPISGSSLIPPPGIVKAILLTRDCLYT